eukprot:Gb_16236 [translate_table: standard]
MLRWIYISFVFKVLKGSVGKLEHIWTIKYATSNVNMMVIVVVFSNIVTTTVIVSMTIASITVIVNTSIVIAWVCMLNVPLLVMVWQMDLQNGMSTLNGIGLGPPTEVGIVGFDDGRLSNWFVGPLLLEEVFGVVITCWLPKKFAWPMPQMG